MAFAVTALLLSLPSLLGSGRPAPSDDLAFMRQALAEAQKAADQGEVPVGAVLVAGDGRTVIARTHNLVARRNDPTAHAELLAIRRSTSRFVNWRLTNTTLYCTLEPCPMCLGYRPPLPPPPVRTRLEHQV